MNCSANQAAPSPCPANCSKAGMCLSETIECPCSDPDRTGNPEERISKALAIGYVCGVLFWTLVSFFIARSLPQ